MWVKRSQGLREAVGGVQGSLPGARQTPVTMETKAEGQAWALQNTPGHTPHMTQSDTVTPQHTWIHTAIKYHIVTRKSLITQSQTTYSHSYTPQSHRHTPVTTLNHNSCIPKNIHSCLTVTHNTQHPVL